MVIRASLHEFDVPFGFLFLQNVSTGNIIPKIPPLKIANIALMPLNSEKKIKIAVFGSAFNPPSLGHKSAIDKLDHFDRVLLMPSISHAWGKEMLDYEQRCRLVELFIADLASTKVEISKLEQELYKPGESVTTFTVLNELQSAYPCSELTFIMGPDNLLSFHKFSRYKEILARWSLLVCPETVPIRSTKIRDSLRSGRTISDLVTPKVASYLAEYQPY
jgi:nicotinate-nucleotide adenylyltransferase